jgi:flagellar motor switch protein FliM
LADSRERARDLVCWNAEQRAIMEARLFAVFAEWRADWGLPEPESSDATVGQLGDAEALHALSDQMFGPLPVGPASETPDSGTSMSQSLARQAWDDWLARLCSVLGVEPMHARSTMEQYRAVVNGKNGSAWDARMHVDIPWWVGLWSLRLDVKAVNHVLGPSHPSSPNPRPALHATLVPLSVALAAHELKVSVQLTPVSLGIGQIQDLRIGDVIPLPQSLEAPARLLVEAGALQATPFCAAWLGQRQGQMAVELLPFTS